MRSMLSSPRYVYLFSLPLCLFVCSTSFFPIFPCALSPTSSLKLPPHIYCTSANIPIPQSPQILTSQIRSEIASSSERAYPSLPISSTKSLLFLDSEGAVIDFARSRGWILKDGMIYFPKESEAAAAVDGEDAAGAGAGTGAGVGGAKEEMSKLVIENALGYARELETIV